MFDATRSVRPGRRQPLPLDESLHIVSQLRVPSTVIAAHRSLFDEAVSPNIDEYTDEDLAA